ncbi:MAG: HNH endonuclease signature motif containing protein [Nitrospirales bacterium]|nr:HNH endonuclease [Nitrospirales bacterium]
MPNRFIKESCRTSRHLNALSDGAERLFWRLVTLADDYGRFHANPQIVRSLCFPLSPEKIPITEIEKYLDELGVDIAKYYEVDGELFGFFVKWNKHQRVRCAHSKFPPPPNDEGQWSTTFFQRAISEELKSQIIKRDKHCLCCLSSTSLVLDHIIPVSSGGKATVDNLQLLCNGCNKSKYMKILNFLKPGDNERQFAADRRRLRQNAALNENENESVNVNVKEKEKTKKEKEVAGGPGDVEIFPDPEPGAEDPKPEVSPDQVTMEWLVERFDQIPGVAPTGKIVGSCLKTVKARIREHPKKLWWEQLFTEQVEPSLFLCGGKTDFQASLIWLCGPKILAKVASGFYVKKTAKVSRLPVYQFD